MMNGADTLSMSLYDYTGALFNWSKAHDPKSVPVAHLSEEEALELEAEAAAIDWDSMKVEANGNG